MISDEKALRLEKWNNYAKEYISSDMTQKEFCDKKNLSLPQFVYYYGQYKRNEEARLNNFAFAPVKISGHEKTSQTNDIKLSLPNGFQCAFQSHIDMAQIKRLIEVLLSC